MCSGASCKWWQPVASVAIRAALFGCNSFKAENIAMKKSSSFAIATSVVLGCISPLTPCRHSLFGTKAHSNLSDDLAQPAMRRLIIKPPRPNHCGF